MSLCGNRNIRDSYIPEYQRVRPTSGLLEQSATTRKNETCDGHATLTNCDITHAHSMYTHLCALYIINLIKTHVNAHVTTLYTLQGQN